MSGVYKSANFINFDNIKNITTVKDLKTFVLQNMHMTDEEIYETIKPLMPVATDIIYIQNTIRKIKRKRKIELLLNNEQGVDNK